MVVAQLDHRERLAEIGQLGQLALRRHQRHLLVRRDGVVLAVERRGRADDQRAGRRCRLLQLEWQREDVGAVIFAQGPGAVAVELSDPFGPAATFVGVLQPTDQREGFVLDAPRGKELQRTEVVEQLGHLADARQRFALSHDRTLAVRANRERRLGGTKLDRRTAARARGTIMALAARVVSHGTRATQALS